MDTVTTRPISASPTEDAVVTVMKGAVGAHVGILYRVDDEGTRRHLHLAWHFKLMDEAIPPTDDVFWIEPCLDDLALADLRASARLIAKRQQDGRVPYAFRPADARFNPAGTLQLNQSHGLTCATFIILVFVHASINLLDATTWDQDRSSERRREDDAAQVRLADYLRKEPEAQKHAELVAGEVGCTRIRAEEVAAASGMTRHPITFARAEPQGRHVLGVVHAVSEVKRAAPPPEGVGASGDAPAES